MEIEIDPAVMRKVIEAEFNTIPVTWFRTLYYYMIDSDFRTTKRLDTFIQEQLENPNPELVKLAESLKSDNIDETIVNILKWVRENVTYEYDNINYGKNEFWDIAQNTITLKKGDCDDQNGLIYVLARLAGIPPYVIYCAIGDVNGGGHFWCLYYSTREDKLVSIDSTYYPTLKSVKDRPEFSLTTNRYQSIWFLFSDKYIYKYSD